MARRVFRVCRARYARLDGAGAKLAGGRWNSPGQAVVYMAESIALAVLENLARSSTSNRRALNPATEVEFVGWRPFRNCWTDT
jgi:RES domain-containing protein